MGEQRAAEFKPQPHGQIGMRKSGVYYCTDCGQNINSPECRPTFNSLLNDPAQQLDTEGVVIASVLSEQERNRLRSEGWRACVEHLQREYHRAADRWPDKVPVVMLDGEQVWANALNLAPARAAAPDALREAGEALAARLEALSGSSSECDDGIVNAVALIREVLDAHPTPGGGT